MTIEADVKARIVAASIAVLPAAKIFRDMAPDNEPLPYATIQPEISEVPSLQGDGGTTRRRRLIQVDVWEDRALESLTLADAVVAALDGRQPATGGATRFYVQSRQRLLEEDVGIVHTALTVSVHRP